MSIRISKEGGRILEERTSHGAYAFTLQPEASGKALRIVDEAGVQVGVGRFEFRTPAPREPRREAAPPRRSILRLGNAVAYIAKLLGFKETPGCECEKKRLLLNYRGWLWALFHPIAVFRMLKFTR